MDFAVVACAFSPFKDSMVRVSMVGNGRSFFLLSLSGCFVCDASSLVTVPPAHSEVSGMVRVVRGVVRFFLNLADRSNHHVEFSDFHRGSRISVVRYFASRHVVRGFAQHVVEQGLTFVLFVGYAVIVIAFTTLV